MTVQTVSCNYCKAPVNTLNNDTLYYDLDGKVDFRFCNSQCLNTWIKDRQLKPVSGLSKTSPTTDKTADIGTTLIQKEEGFDVSGMDLTVKPEDDFFHYAVGKWIKQNEIPPGRPRWGAFDELRLKTTKQLQNILETPITPHAQPEELMIKGLYQSVTDMETRNNAGIQPIEHILALVESVTDKKSLLNVVVTLQSMGISSFFTWGVGNNPNNSKEKIIHLAEGGLNLPDFEMYLEDKDTEANKHHLKREAYLEYLQQLLTLAEENENKVEGYAKKILTFETTLANNFLDKDLIRDPKVTTNIVTVDGLKTLSPSGPWDEFFTKLQQNPNSINIQNTKFFEALSKIFDNIDISTAKLYLYGRVLDKFSASLTEDFYKTHFQLYNKTLQGVDTPRPLKERAAEIVGCYLGDALGKIYVAKHFPPHKKRKLDAMVVQVKSALVNRINHLSWMERGTKEMAIAKVQAMDVLIGYPDDGYWTDYCPLTDVCSNAPYATNAMIISKFLISEELNELSKPVDKKKWPWPPQVVNACNCPDENKIVFPAGILQFPFTSDDDAVTWGAIGTVIAHEIIHSFDDSGRKYDLNGNLNDWWTEKDSTSFEEHAKVIKEQFDNYSLTFADGTVEHVRGKMTLGENIADLGGLIMAFDAFRESLKKTPLENIDGFTPEQRFFLGYAQVWRIKQTEAFTIRRLGNDPHSPAIYRVNGPLSQLKSFQEVFNLPETCQMVIPDDKKSKMWGEA